MTSEANINEILTYKGHPLMRMENIIYYGSMEDPYIIMMQILDSKQDGDLNVATRISVQLQRTANVRLKEKIVKKAEKDSLWHAMDLAAVWLDRALAAK